MKQTDKTIEAKITIKPIGNNGLSIDFVAIDKINGNLLKKFQWGGSFDPDDSCFPHIIESIKGLVWDGYAEKAKKEREEKEALRISRFAENAKYIEAVIPVYKEDNEYHDLENMRQGDNLCFIIRISDGQIVNYKPAGCEYHLFMKIVDNGLYSLLDENKQCIIQMKNYVPNKLIPPKDGFGDYLEFDIDEQGKITNWHKKPLLIEFDDFVIKNQML